MRELTSHAIRGGDNLSVIGYARTVNLANETMSTVEHCEHMGVIYAERHTTGISEVLRAATQAFQNWFSLTPDLKKHLPENLCLVDVHLWLTDNPETIVANDRTMTFQHFYPRGVGKFELEDFRKGFLAQSQSAYSQAFEAYDAKDIHKDELLTASVNFEDAYNRNLEAQNDYHFAKTNKASFQVIAELEINAQTTEEEMNSAKDFSDNLKKTVRRKQVEHDLKSLQNQDFLTDKLVFLDKPPYDPEPYSG